jgi:hypothetical protein
MLFGKVSIRSIAAIFLSFLVLPMLPAQETAVSPEASSSTDASALPAISEALPKEAPASLFVTENGSDVELMISGSWKASLLSTPKLSFGSLGTSFSFSGSPLLFSQNPDILLSLVVNGSWFLEAIFSQAFADSLFAVGYRGKENEIVKEIRAGNNGLKFSPRPFLDFGSSGNKSFGVSASFGSAPDEKPGFAAQALLRFDSMEAEKTVYIGLERVSETTLQSTDYLTGRFFALPDQNVADIAVFVRSATGSAASDYSTTSPFTYARLDSSAYSYSLSGGTIDFKAALTERTLVAYRRADSLPISVPPASVVTIEGQEAVVIFDPGSRLEGEILSRYDPGEIDPEITGAQFTIESTERGNLDAVFGARLFAGNEIMEVYKLDLAASETQALARRPFEAIAPEIYEPGVLPSGESPIRITVTTRQKKERLEIDSKALADTIRVFRDGVRDSNFSYVPGSGFVDLKRPPLAQEKIEIEYMTASNAFSEDFVAGLSFDYFFTGELGAYAAMGTRWSMPGSKVSRPDSLTAGYVGASAGLAWKTEEWQASFDLGVKYSREDANDACRIDGMEDFLHTQKASSGLWLRSVLPASFPEEGRSALIYRDYSRSDVFGTKTLATLESGYSPEAADQNSKQGPYPIGDSTFGTASLAEFSFDSSKTWCGVQAKLDSGMIENLPQAQSLVIPLRYLPGSGALPSFALQAGMMGKSPFDASSEIQALPDSRFIAVVALSSAPTESWAEYEIPLTEAVIAGMREGASIMLLISSAAPSSGRCLIGDLRLKGTSYVKGAEVPSRDHLTLGQLYSDGPESVYPGALNDWRESTSGNAYLRLALNGNSGGNAASAYKSLPAFPVKAYKHLSFFIRWNLASFSNASLTLTMNDADGTFLNAVVPLSAAAPWGRADIDLDAGTGRIVYPDGTSAEINMSAIRERGSGGASLRWTLSGIESGLVDLDEFGLTESRAALTGEAAFALEKKKTGSLLKISGLDLVSGLEAELDGRFGIEKDSFDYASQAKAGVFVFPFELSAATSLAGKASGGQAAQWPVFKTNHAIALPFTFGSAGTSFSQDSSSGDFSQRDELKLAYQPLSFSAEATATQTMNKLSQAWKSAFGLSAFSEILAIENAWMNDAVQENPLAGLLYPRAWIGSYSFLLPKISPDANQRGQSRAASLAFTAVSDREGFERHRDSSLFAGATYVSGSSFLRGSEINFSLTPLVKAGRNGVVRIIPEYSRTSKLAALGYALSFKEDVDFLAYSLDCLPSVWRAIPLAELFDSRALNELRALPFDPEKAVLEAKAGIGMERDGMLGAWELAVPSIASYSLCRVSERAGSVSTEKLVHSASLGMRALDLFGRKGIHPLSGLFDTDEYGMDHKLKLSQNVVGSDSSYQYSATLFGLFGISKGDSLDIRDNLRLGSGEERFAESLLVTRSISQAAGRSEENIRERLLEWITGRERKNRIEASSPLMERWLRDELVKTTIVSLGTSMSSNDSGLFSLEIPLSYESVLSMERAFRFSAGARLSLGWRKNQDYSQFDIGLSLSTQARLEF